MRFITSFVLLSVLVICAAVAILLDGPVSAADWIANPGAALAIEQGKNPAPVTLNRPVAQPLSAMAQLGKQVFFDKNLSSSGQLACASCHSPANYYAPASSDPAMYGGPKLAAQGVRTVPTLMYLERQPNFSIGPDPAGDNDAPVPLPQLAVLASNTTKVQKTAQDTSQSAANIVPAGGLFWDGRANTLQIQALGPLLSPYEMDGGSIDAVAAKLQAAPYANLISELFGPTIFSEPKMLVSEVMFAVARYQIEEVSFHPYTSKYDYWLEGKSKLSWAEMRGYVLYNDPNKGDCGACHLDQPSLDGQPPLFTDHQFEALGAPRNPKLLVNQVASYHDLGICGPYRTDLASQTQLCGMFLTPTLRNSATRQVFFHNGVFHNLQQVLDFYDFRDTDPAKVYPVGADGKVAKYNDLPKADWANVDTADPPLDRQLGQAPALTHGQEKDIIAFLKTLTDGYIPADGKPAT